MNRDMRSIASLILGLALGSAAVQAHTWQMRHTLSTQARLSQLDAQHWRQESLRLRDQLAVINRRSERKTYVQTVNLEVIKNPVPLIDVEAALEPYTESLLGVSLASIKLSLIYQLFEHRRVVLGSRLYEVSVKALLVAPDVTILLHLNPIGRSHAS